MEVDLAAVNEVALAAVNEVVLGVARIADEVTGVHVGPLQTVKIQCRIRTETRNATRRKRTERKTVRRINQATAIAESPPPVVSTFPTGYSISGVPQIRPRNRHKPDVFNDAGFLMRIAAGGLANPLLFAGLRSPRRASPDETIDVC